MKGEFVHLCPSRQLICWSLLFSIALPQVGGRKERLQRHEQSLLQYAFSTVVIASNPGRSGKGKERRKQASDSFILLSVL